jgi:hypothetical protein
MTHETSDPILHGLASLSAPVPTRVRAERVRARCLRVLDERRLQHALLENRSRLGRAFDATILLVVGIYLAGAVSEVIRLLN